MQKLPRERYDDDPSQWKQDASGEKIDFGDLDDAIKLLQVVAFYIADENLSRKDAQPIIKKIQDYMRAEGSGPERETIIQALHEAIKSAVPEPDYVELFAHLLGHLG